MAQHSGTSMRAIYPDCPPTIVACGLRLSVSGASVRLDAWHCRIVITFRYTTDDRIHASPALADRPNSDDVLDREKVIVALEAKREQFSAYAGELRRQRATLTGRLEAIQAFSYTQLAKFIAATGVAWPGALPTPEFDRARQLCIPFGHIWTTHEDARAWARQVLTNRPIIAVDGSQIAPDKDLNIPVGAVQIGWFINPHQQGVPYTKDVEFEILGPAELMEDAEDEADDRAMPNWRVNQERFVRECARLCILMEAAADLPDLEKPLCFFDGSFIVSFAGQLRPERAAPYLRARWSICSNARARRVCPSWRLWTARTAATL